MAYGTDVDRLRTLLIEVAEGTPHVCKRPEPRVRFRQFGDSSLNFELLLWIPTPELRGKVLDAVNTAVYKVLNEERIEIPYPKRDVYVRALPPLSSSGDRAAGAPAPGVPAPGPQPES